MKIFSLISHNRRKITKKQKKRKLFEHHPTDKQIIGKEKRIIIDLKYDTQ